MESSISINKHIFSILTSDKSLKEMVGTKIFPIVADDDVKFPYIILERTSITPYTYKGGVGYDKVTFQIKIADSDYINTINIAEKVRELLELKTSNYFNKRIEFSNCKEDFMNDTYRQILEFVAII